MFGRKDNEEDTTQTQDVVAPSPAMQRSPIAEATRVSPGPMPTTSNRRMESRRTAPVERMRAGDGDERKLTVGKGLSLSGEIAACDVLVVEGKVEAKLTDGKLIEITETGQFRGSVEIENADIAGRYDGELTVHGRLTVRGTGRISGIVKYGELEVNAGGQIIGEMQVVGGGTTASVSPTSYKSAKYAAPVEDEDDGALFSRKTASGN